VKAKKKRQYRKVNRRQGDITNQPAFQTRFATAQELFFVEEALLLLSNSQGREISMSEFAAEAAVLRAESIQGKLRPKSVESAAVASPSASIPA